MKRNDIGLFNGLAKMFCDFAGDESVAYPVETILAEFILLGNLGINGISGYVFRDALVELAVKVGQILGFGELLVGDAHDVQAGRVVSV